MAALADRRADRRPWRGFRPFFVLAAALAALFVPLWLLRFAGLLPAGGHLAAAAWHGHEMIFGFVAAVLAGFLTIGMGGGRIWALAGLWLAARALLLWPVAPVEIAVALDLAFLPLLVLLRRPPLWQGGKLMSVGILAVVAALTALNLWIHGTTLGGGDTARPLAASVGALAVLLVLVGGRLVPGHTRATLRQGVGLSLTAAETGGLACGAAYIAAEAAGWPAAAGIAALLVGLIQVWRLLRWWHPSVAAEPLLWILHAGFAWLALGFLLIACAHLTGWPEPAVARHAILVGAVGSMTLGIMSRLSLQHTGRRLLAGRAAVAAFALVQIAAAARMAGPGTDLFLPALTLAAAAWTGAFLLFLAANAPALLFLDRRGG